mgnify:CR=1 FL=1
MNIVVHPLEEYELSIVEDLLFNNDLPIDDIYEPNIRFLVAKANDKLIGTIAIEKYDQFGLLRSLVVEKEYRNEKIGERLINHLLISDFSVGITDLYLLTTTAKEYFVKFGFREVNRIEVPIELRQTNEFVELCPETAIVMHKKI